MTIYQTVTSGLESAYYVSGILLCIFGGMGLRQITIAKKDIILRSQRQAAEIAVKQCEKFAETLVPLQTHYLQAMQAHGIPVYLDAIHGYDETAITKIDKNWLKDCMYKLHHVDSETNLAILNFINGLEAYALHFTHGIGDENIAFGTTSVTYCNMTQQVYPIILDLRNRGIMFTNLVTLDERWRKQLFLQRLNSQKRELEDKISAIPPSADIPIVGTKI